MRFDLRPEDRALIDAALRLGDWLADYEATTATQVQQIRVVQAALRRLPEDSPELEAEYGFTVQLGDAGLYRSWWVSLWRHGVGEPGILEIFNTYKSDPEGLNYLEDVAHESGIELHADEPNRYTSDWLEWIEEVRDPRVWIVAGAIVEVEAAVRPWAQ